MSIKDKLDFTRLFFNKFKYISLKVKGIDILLDFSVKNLIGVQYKSLDWDDNQVAFNLRNITDSMDIPNV